MGRRKATVWCGLLASGAVAVLSAAVAALATRPRLAAMAFGGEANAGRSPDEVGLDFADIEYSAGCRAWWIPVDGSAATVVIVHGFETSEDPRATDPGPRLELAAMLAESGFSSLVISLGYGNGTHPHSGGVLEAADITAAVRWAAETSEQPVAIAGFSAGGHAAVAASNECNVFAVVTDSAFVDFSDIVKAQAADLLGVPASVFGLVPAAMRLLAQGHAPINLESVAFIRNVPMLHIHGDADSAIDHSNLERLAKVTGGDTLTIHGADHIDSLRVDAAGYGQAVVAFLTRSLSNT